MERKYIFIILFFIIGCDNKLDWIKTPEKTIPIVYSIAPDTGTVGTVVTVSGANFSATISKNKITINGTAATVTQASTSSLTFTAPNGTSGSVVVKVNGKSAENKPVFTYQ